MSRPDGCPNPRTLRLPCQASVFPACTAVRSPVRSMPHLRHKVSTTGWHKLWVENAVVGNDNPALTDEKLFRRSATPGSRKSSSTLVDGRYMGNLHRALDLFTETRLCRLRDKPHRGCDVVRSLLLNTCNAFGQMIPSLVTLLVRVQSVQSSPLSYS